MKELALHIDLKVGCDDLDLLAEAAGFYPEVHKFLSDFFESEKEVARVRGQALLEDGSKGLFEIRFELADELRRLANQVRAWDFDGRVVQKTNQ